MRIHFEHYHSNGISHLKSLKVCALRVVLFRYPGRRIEVCPGGCLRPPPRHEGSRHIRFMIGCMMVVHTVNLKHSCPRVDAGITTVFLWVQACITRPVFTLLRSVTGVARQIAADVAETARAAFVRGEEMKAMSGWTCTERTREEADNGGG